MQNTNDANIALRRSIYAILIVVALGVALGRIAAVDEVSVADLDAFYFQAKLNERLQTEKEKRGLTDEQVEQLRPQLAEDLRTKLNLRRPWLSANDRSRWNTIRALVEPDMRVIRLVTHDGEKRFEYVWYSIDKTVAVRGWDTIDKVQHGLPDDPDGPEYFYSSKPPLLPTMMAAPYWVIYNTTGYSFGTHPYAVTRALLVIINLIPYGLLLVVVALAVERWGQSDWGRIFVVAAACFGTLLTPFVISLNNHLPAALCTAIALYAGLRVWFDGSRHWGWFVLAGFFAAMAATCDLPALAFFGALGLVLLVKAPVQTLAAGLPAGLVVFVAFFATNYMAHQDLEPPYAHRDADDNWYDYEGSHWNDPRGMDIGEKSRADYILHSLVGHHGVFSLTPMWILSFVGLGLWLTQGEHSMRREAGMFILCLSLIVFAFYMIRGQNDRNYGGLTCGFRWMFWLAPMWLVAMLPAVDKMAKSRVLQAVALVLLGFSALSVAYPIWTPWSQPWIYNWLAYMKALPG